MIDRFEIACRNAEFAHQVREERDRGRYDTCHSPSEVEDDLRRFVKPKD